MRSRKNTFGSTFHKFSRSPILIALGAGLYPLVFYYSRNFGMVNSWEQLAFFTLLFLLLPLVLFTLLKWISKRNFAIHWGKYVLPFFSVFIFLLFIKIILYAGIQKKLIAGIFVISILAAYFLHKHFHKWVLLQFLLAAVGCIGLLPLVVKYVGYSSKWTQQPDDIEQVIFEKRPNIYYIQPDGYPSFSQMESEFYSIDNSGFNTFLEQMRFEKYPHFRSNYITTLTSNSATFMMRHHYYHHSKEYSEMLHARENIISDNTVLTILKNNGYKTHFITEHPYLLTNRPEMGFDHTNFDYAEIPYITTGFNVQRDVYTDLEEAMAAKNKDGNFFFIEIFDPSHIATTKESSMGKVAERDQWLQKLAKANAKLQRMVALIVKNDPNALIMIMADHGGFVGLDYTRQVYTKTSDRQIIYTTFGAMLAIRWPNNARPEVASNLESCVNVFRILFSYLGNEPKYLKHLEEDGSYLIIKEGAEPGVYQYIDDKGEIVFKKV